MSKKEVKKENTPPCQIPYREIHHPFRFQFVIPGTGISILEDANGVLYLSAKGGSLDDLVAGDNIEIDRTEDGKVIISSVDTVTDVAAGQNVTITIDPDTGAAVINAITGGATNEHYKGVFDTAQDLIDYDTDPEVGDYGLIKHVEYSNGGDTTWNGQYKYCFYINGSWTVVDQMLTFTKNLDLLQQFYSVGGSSPVIYLHEVARSGDFRDLNNVPIVATPEVTVDGTTVTASCATEGAEIWYTTDGSMPHVNGTKYTGPITVTEATSFRFVGIKNGMINSLEAVVSADYSLDAPGISLDWHDGTVTMTNPNVDGNNDPVGEIRYTTDGSEPDAASTLYSGPFVINASTHFKAIVIDSGVESPVSDETFQQVRIRNAHHSGNGFTGTFGQFMDSYFPDNTAEIHYTTDGENPDYSSDVMTAIIYFPFYGGIKTIKAKGFLEGYVPSTVLTYTFGAEKPVSPPISFDAETNTVDLCTSYKTDNVGVVWGVVSGLYYDVELRPDKPLASTNIRIIYTLDGSTPTKTNGTLYTGPFVISGNVTVKAVVVAYDQYLSDVATENIVITDEPSIVMDYMTGTVTMQAPAGASIYYTLDGSTPTSGSTLYTGQIPDNISSMHRTFKAIAVINGQASGVTTASYDRLIWNLPNYSVVANYPAGYYTAYAPGTPNYADVYCGITHPDGSIFAVDYSRYTDSGVAVDLYDAENPTIVVFKAVRPGYLPTYQLTRNLGDAAPTAPAISYDDETDLVTMALAGNTESIPLQTNNNVPTMGARIYYTTDGSTPTASSTLYTGPFTLPEGSTAIKAITVCYGEWESDVTTEEISGGGGTYGVRFAKNSDSADGTRVGDMTLHVSLPIQSGMKRCLLLDNGTVNYYLDPDDSTKKADGTAADLTGTDGQYMVEIPEFYAALLETDDYVEFSVSTDPVEGYFHYPKMYVSADEACLDRATGKLAAVVNDTANYRGGSNDASKDSDPYLTLLQRPVSNISWQDFLDAAQLRGSGWCNYMNMVNSALYFLFITEYATRNTQKAYNPTLTAEGYRQGGIGPDATEFYDWEEIDHEPFIPTGFTASLGNNTGVKDLSVQWESEGVTKTHTAHVSSYRGVSVPIGHLGKAASGYFLRATTAEDVYAYFRNNPDAMSYSPVEGDVSVRVPASISGQPVGKLGFAGGNLYPAEGTGDPISDPTQPLTTYYCDGAYVYGSDMASEIYDPDFPFSIVPVLGGDAAVGSYCGFACATFDSDPSGARPFFGSRLCFISNN